MVSVLLPYRTQRRCAWTFNALILASNAIGLSLLAAPLAWYQAGSLLSRMFNSRHSQDHIISTLAPHIISLPSEVMLLSSVGGMLMGLAARKQAQIMAIDGPVPRMWSAGIAFGLLSNLAGIVANAICLLSS